MKSLDILTAECNPETGAIAPGRKETDGAWLYPLSLRKRGDGMNDFEMLTIVLMIITLVFTVHIANHK